MKSTVDNLWEIAKKCYDLGVEAAEQDWRDEEGLLEGTPYPSEDDPLMADAKRDHAEHFEWLEETWSAGYLARGKDLTATAENDSSKISRAELAKLKAQCVALGKEAAEGDWAVASLEDFPTPHDSPTMFGFEHQYPYHYSILVEYWREGYYEIADQLNKEDAAQADDSMENLRNG